MLYRHSQFYAHADTPTLLKLYVAFIRPHLEYACTIWSPSTKKDIVALENVQKFALKVSLKQWTLSYEDMLDRANIPSLSSRRKNLSLCQLYNIVHSGVGPPIFSITYRPVCYNHRSNNTRLLYQPFAHTSRFLNSFFPRAISAWNSLPTSVVSCTTVTSFKRAVS